MPAAYQPSGTSGDDAPHRHAVDLGARFLEALEACRDLAIRMALEIVRSAAAAEDEADRSRVW